MISTKSSVIDSTNDDSNIEIKDDTFGVESNIIEEGNLDIDVVTPPPVELKPEREQYFQVRTNFVCPKNKRINYKARIMPFLRLLF